MDTRTKENLAIAAAAGILTFIVTFITFHYVRPSIKEMLKTETKQIMEIKEKHAE